MSVSKTIGLPEEGGYVTWEVSAPHYVPQSASAAEVHQSVVEYVNLSQETYTITFYLTPSDAVLTVDGSVVTGSGNTRVIDNLHFGDLINWEVSKEGYLPLHDELVIDRDMTITVSLDGIWYDHFTFSINPTPADSIVIINGQQRLSVYEEVDTLINWSVSKEGYHPQSGSLVLTGDVSMDVVLSQTAQYTFTITPHPSDATVFINGQQRSSITVSEGTPIEWSVSKTNYITQTGSFTLSADYSIDVYLVSVSAEPLTFTATSAGDIWWKHNNGYTKTIQYSINNGAWTSITSSANADSSNKISLSVGDVVKFKGNNTSYCEPGNQNAFAYFSNFNGSSYTSARFDVSGDITSLIGGDNYQSVTSYDSNGNIFAELFRGCRAVVNTSALVLRIVDLVPYCYYRMFESCENMVSYPQLNATVMAEGCYSRMFYATAITSIPQLNAMTLAVSCYQHMFYGCTHIVSVPKYCLPATTLENSCYGTMFGGCTSLVAAPELPATTIAQNCYKYMFTRCTALQTGPEVLPATQLEYQCYGDMFSYCSNLVEAPRINATSFNGMYCCSAMFSNCTSLQYAPSLPATTLSQGCYQNMFSGCTSLVESPVLPATTLAIVCYSGMFNGCTSLNKLTCLATDISAYQCTNNWVNNVASLGTFVKNPNMSGWLTGVSGIPNNWTTIDYTS